MEIQANSIQTYLPQKNHIRPSSVSFGKIGQYWHTIRYLRPKQVWHQIHNRFLPPRLTDTLPIRSSQVEPLSLVRWPSRPETCLGQSRFRFLNREHNLNWLTPGLPHLWQYNLHYFDYLHQPGMDRYSGLQLIKNWIQEHPVTRADAGWEPYPLSLRLVNWIKFCSPEKSLPEDILQSLCLQAANLRNQIEYHLLGNHLFSNGKALWFAGIFLKDEELTCLGREIVLEELKEQFLPDGGHFELSPMYHAILLEDVLDLINLCQSGKFMPDREALSKLAATAGRALAWLKGIVDEEGRIPLLNDSAHGVAASFKDIQAYAQKLDVKSCQSICKTVLGNWEGYNLSGYRVLSDGPMRLIFDAARLGPEYLPGHAHCDMLAILLDFEGKSIFTDTGVYEYEETRRRAYSRGTAAHNTVILDGLDQAELWKGFRMGRRGYPVNFRQRKNSLGASHTGFGIWRKGLIHNRSLLLSDNGFEVKDRVFGPGTHHFEAFFHCAPDVRVQSHKNGMFTLNDQLRIEPRGADIRLTMSDYYPEFGTEEKRPCLVMSGSFSRKTEFGLRCTYSF